MTFYTILMINEDSYKKGDIVRYHYFGEIDRVLVVDNLSNKTHMAYILKVLEVVQESRIVNPSKIGDEFECSKARNNNGFFGLWNLLDDSNEENFEEMTT